MSTLVGSGQYSSSNHLCRVTLNHSDSCVKLEKFTHAVVNTHVDYTSFLVVGREIFTSLVKKWLSDSSFYEIYTYEIFFYNKVLPRIPSRSKLIDID